MNDFITTTETTRTILNSRDNISALLKTARRKAETEDEYKRRMEDLLTRSDSGLNLFKRREVLKAADLQIEGRIFQS